MAASAPTAQAHQPAGFMVALRKLRDAQKSGKGAPPYSLYINRPLGRVFAAAAFQLGLTPNQVTYISGAMTFTGIVVLAVVPTVWWSGLLVAALLVLGYALDAADGQLARLRGGGSKTGEWLDHMLDAAKTSSLHLAVLITAYRHFGLDNQLWLLVPMVFGVVSAVHFFGFILVEQLIREHRAQNGIPTPPKAANTPVKTLLKLPTDYGVLCLVFVLLGAPLVFFAAYTFLAVGTTGYLLLIVRKWFHDVSALDAPVRAA